MERRTFLKRLSGGILLVSALPLWSRCKGAPLRFGIVTDSHYADRDTLTTRYYRDSFAKMQEAVDRFNRSHLDFIIELGDLKDKAPDNDPEAALQFLDRIESVLQPFDGPVYHVLGNHDEDCIGKEDFLAHVTNPGECNGKKWYAFSCKGVRCIVLDANFNADLSDYDRGNFNWKSAWLPPEELEWLDRELSAHPRMQTLVFIHQLLDSFSDIPSSVCVNNAQEAVAILERHPQVRAVFQGHHHAGHYSWRGGIHYWTMKGMIENSYPEHNSYAVVEMRPDGSLFIEGFHDCPSSNLPCL